MNTFWSHCIYHDQDQLQEALGLLKPAVEVSIKVIGQQHPDTQHYAKYLASVYKRLGMMKEAEDMENRLLSQ